ncbi:cysteine export CydDC family ABC transporter permease subunit/ATP-binding protein CydD [Desulfosporosinus acidiphilus SJ4]|uniref:Cysteine export CydDC family ABC transporter permease subunit/ATP-binding protein CydD n=1 Tax=Desulfosporosinus acidiphilus (strain DSM 22704 / JCM 16185 / SJ4) TaxID=646529 RepID=I4D693_DESAJ|nr:thiol reductant ABC exporter subunit CydD [Desulfosporosinus acidiphilus]AFM41317.1 cysteine export CydDC family ABC transporter permease subunit/ATP-binding protein CydD [Desulfosporosinus acidiphilus SJ4]
MFDRRLVKEANHVRGFLFLSLSLGCGIALLAVAQAWFFSQTVANVFLKGLSLKNVGVALGIILGIILTRALFQWGSEVFAQEAALRVKSNLRQRLIDRLFTLGPLYIRKEKSGELISTLVSGTDSLVDYFAKYIPQLLLAVMIPIIILSFVFPQDWKSGSILLLTGPLIPIFMILIGKLAEKKSLQQWQSLSWMNGHFLDILRGITTLKVFGRSKDQIRVIARVSNSFRESTLSVLRIAFLSALMLEFFATMSTALVAVAIGLRLVYGTLSFSTGLFLLLLAPEFYTPLRTLGLNFHAGLSGVNAAVRIYEILDAPLPTMAKSGIDHCTIDILAETYQITFEHVSLTYDQDETPALQNINISLSSGESIALVGPSGAGKTSLVQLLMGFVEPTSGQIYVNGKLLETISMDNWREQIGYISQNPYLFAGSILENILLGRPQAEMREVINAAESANAHGFIMSFPQGYDTILGEGGYRLSGGQAQRIAMARIFLKDAPLLIFDEPTSSLDLESEDAIQNALNNLTQGKTSIIIAHRLNTIQHTNRILVMDQGRIVEEGNHEVLLEKQGLYYDLVRKARGSSL